MKNTILFFIWILITQHVAAQSETEKKVSFRVVLDTVPIENVNILNLRSEKATISDSKGAFSMLVKLGDVLVISAINIETMRKTILANELQSGEITIKMTLRTNSLKEVIINENSAINAVSMGILPKEAKKYTPAERKLRTAGDFKPIDLLGILEGALAVDPILNAINGRTKRLKKEVVIEKNEKLLMKLEDYYKEDYYTEVLKIPKEYIKGFQYYLIEDAEFVNALNAKNKTMTSFLAKKLASDYIEIIHQEQN